MPPDFYSMCTKFISVKSYLFDRKVSLLNKNIFSISCPYNLKNTEHRNESQIQSFFLLFLSYTDFLSKVFRKTALQLKQKAKLYSSEAQYRVAVAKYHCH